MKKASLILYRVSLILSIVGVVLFTTLMILALIYMQSKYTDQLTSAISNGYITVNGVSGSAYQKATYLQQTVFPESALRFGIALYLELPVIVICIIQMKSMTASGAIASICFGARAGSVTLVIASIFYLIEYNKEKKERLKDPTNKVVGRDVWERL